MAKSSRETLTGAYNEIFNLFKAQQKSQLNQNLPRNDNARRRSDREYSEADEEEASLNAAAAKQANTSLNSILNKLRTIDEKTQYVQKDTATMKNILEHIHSMQKNAIKLEEKLHRDLNNDWQYDDDDDDDIIVNNSNNDSTIMDTESRPNSSMDTSEKNIVGTSNEQSVSILETELEGLKSKIAEAEKLLTEKRLELEKTHTELASLKGAHVTFSQINSNLTELIKNLFSDLPNDTDITENDDIKTTSDSETDSTSTAELVGKVKKLITNMTEYNKRQVNELQETLDKNTREYEKTLEESKEEVEQLEKENERLEQNNQQYASVIKDLEKEKEDLTISLKSEQAELESVQSDFNLQQQQLIDLKNKLKESDSTSVKLNDEIIVLKKDKSRLEELLKKETADKKTNMANLEGVLAKRNTEIANLKREVEELKKQPFLKQLRKEKVGLKQDLSQAKSELQKSENEVTRLKSELSMVQNLNRQLQQNEIVLKREIGNLESKNSSEKSVLAVDESDKRNKEPANSGSWLEKLRKRSPKRSNTSRVDERITLKRPLEEDSEKEEPVQISEPVTKMDTESSEILTEQPASSKPSDNTGPENVEMDVVQAEVAVETGKPLSVEDVQPNKSEEVARQNEELFNKTEGQVGKRRRLSRQVKRPGTNLKGKGDGLEIWLDVLSHA